MMRTQVYIPEQTHHAVKLLAKQRKKNMAELIRYFIVKGLDNEIKTQPKKSLDSLTKLGITGGPKALSRNLDEYLYG